MSAECAYVSQHSVVVRVSALCVRSLVCLRIDRFVQAEETVSVAPAFAVTAGSRAQLVSFALPVPASALCTGTMTFVVQANEGSFCSYRTNYF